MAVRARRAAIRMALSPGTFLVPGVKILPRFRMTPPPSQGGDPGQFEEALAQWLLEQTFFIDFVYRNHKSRRGRGELGDAVVLFDDVALMVQIKAQSSKRDPLLWARKNINKAAKQLSHTNRMLFNGHVRELENPLFGRIVFDPERYKSRIGLIVVAHDAEPFDAEAEVSELAKLEFPVHVLSLRDLFMLMERFDTAGDIIPYLDFRHDMRARLVRKVHDEKRTLVGVANQIRDFLSVVRPGLTTEVLDKSAHHYQMSAAGVVSESPDYRYSLLIDDMIAHIHDQDPSLGLADALDAAALGSISAHLAWLSRDRRILLGKRLLEFCKKGRDGKDYYFAHYQRTRGTATVFLVSSKSRKSRVELLQMLAEAAKLSYGANVVLGVATEPLGNGRSYDFVLSSGPIEPDVLRVFEEHGNPFSSENISLFE